MNADSRTVAAINDYVRVLALVLGERDQATLQHCRRVIQLAESFGRHCGLVNGDLQDLALSALLHDIGKIGIPDQVLHKPGRLDEGERSVMRTHPERGERIVGAIGLQGLEAVARAIRHHHEFFDGGGYPDGLAGEAIPYLSRMVAVIDGYDAMAEARPYHRPRSWPEVLRVLDSESGSKYDPYLLGRFSVFAATLEH